MRLQHAILLPLILAGLSGASAAAETKLGVPAEPQAQESSPREVALDHLLTERSSLEAFEAAVSEARSQGISSQAILEARFIFHVDREEDDAIAALLPEFLKQDAAFRIGDSEIFATREDWLAVLEYVRAIKAIKEGDKAAFKMHITEAFWLSPKQGTAFATHIDRLRMSETMASVRIDFAAGYLPIAGGQRINLSSVMGEKKALLLQFWSPWSAECEGFLPDFAAISKELDSHDIAVATMVMADSPKSLDDVAAMLKRLGTEPPGTWLVDDEKEPLSPVLRIQEVPAMVLVSKEGTILHNGPPDAEEFWTALGKLDGGIKRPPPANGADAR